MSRKKIAILLAGLAALGLIVWIATGGMERATASRIEATIVAKGIPQPIAACMGERMAARLSFNQLRKLNALVSREGEEEADLNMAEFLERMRTVDDKEAIEVTASSAAVCAFSTGTLRL